MATDPKHRLTIQEYLALERQAETKSDYLDGEMFALAGASREHNLISLKIASSLDTQLAESDCEVYAHDMRVRTPDDLLTYPDVVVVCGERRFDDDPRVDTLLNPILIAEVLLVAQDRPSVEHWVRQGDGRWVVEDIQGLEATVELPSVGCRLELKKVYRGVLSPVPST